MVYLKMIINKILHIFNQIIYCFVVKMNIKKKKKKTYLVNIEGLS